MASESKGSATAATIRQIPRVKKRRVEAAVEVDRRRVWGSDGGGGGVSFGMCRKGRGKFGDLAK
ncbi:hypothetical protein COLO4_16147 [Corchorus olitorius]|uniref:Uncharacterized protein n=1 Tax=Corchorus olitorius TaxID=93759 RepID=A0A1R3JJ61_9ROSI|nr:hypothetical protein COLO4_16147 [Corchorus olitorius]